MCGKRVKANVNHESHVLLHQKDMEIPHQHRDGAEGGLCAPILTIPKLGQSTQAGDAAHRTVPQCLLDVWMLGLQRLASGPSTELFTASYVMGSRAQGPWAAHGAAPSWYRYVWGN